MRRSICVLFMLALAACALPLSSQPTLTPSASTVAPAPIPTTASATTAPASSTELPRATAAPFTDSTNLPGPTAGTIDGIDDPAQIAAAKPAGRDQVALAEALKGIGEVPRVARTQPLDVQVGVVETFWVVDFATNTNYQIEAKLRYAGPVVLMYVDTAIESAIDQAAIEKAARQFEQEIYPRNRALFGAEVSPGVDGDPRLTVLNTRLNGVGGYFSSSDSVVKAANRFSNEREMFLISVSNRSFDDSGYGSTLAHEFQHMIEWNIARRSPLWFNEGMSMIAEDVNGFVENYSPTTYLSDPDLQLTTFSQGSLDGRRFSAHYGAAQLFLRYFQEQYAGERGLGELIQADAGNNLDAFVTIAARRRPDITSFGDLYADWAVANILNNPSVGDGRYAYRLLPASPQLIQPQDGETQATVNQFGVDYYGDLQGPLTLTFEGATTVSLTGIRPSEGRAMWWSNRGDDSVSTLTRRFDLGSVQHATLQLAAWYELERDFDYAFVSVSTDDGQTWTSLKGSTTTSDDPQGHNFGNGLTGVSGAPGMPTDSGTRGQWLDEQFDLTPYAGRQVLLRFWVVNDDGYNAPGLLLDNLRIPELGYVDGAEQGDGGWQAQGFVRTSGVLPQSWALRLIRLRDGGASVEHIPVDASGRAVLTLGAGERGVLAVIGTTRFTTEPAAYRTSISAP